MSNETMQKLWDAAGEFRQDTGNLVALRKALAAHDLDEKQATPRKPRAKATAAKAEAKA